MLFRFCCVMRIAAREERPGGVPIYPQCRTGGPSVQPTSTQTHSNPFVQFVALTASLNTCRSGSRTIFRLIRYSEIVACSFTASVKRYDAPHHDVRRHA